MADQTTTERPVLYSYFRSSCSWRVRAALNWKNIEYQYKAVNLLKDEQKSVEYEQLNPQKQVPTLIIDGHRLTQSTSILEYLEETRPDRPLLPKDPFKRSQVRTIVAAISSDIFPLQNLSVMAKVGGSDMTKRAEWASYWITNGFEALEQLFEQTAGTYSVGDEITMADCLLAPMVFNAIRWGVDMTRFPKISKVNLAVSELEPFRRAHAHMQEDCLPELAGKL